MELESGEGVQKREIFRSFDPASFAHRNRIFRPDTSDFVKKGGVVFWGFFETGARIRVQNRFPVQNASGRGNSDGLEHFGTLATLQLHLHRKLPHFEKWARRTRFSLIPGPSLGGAGRCKIQSDLF